MYQLELFFSKKDLLEMLATDNAEIAPVDAFSKRHVDLSHSVLAVLIFYLTCHGVVEFSNVGPMPLIIKVLLCSTSATRLLMYSHTSYRSMCIVKVHSKASKDSI